MGIDVLAGQDRDRGVLAHDGPRPGGPRSAVRTFWWALVVSNHRPPPCKGEEGNAFTSDDAEKPTSDDESD